MEYRYKPTTHGLAAMAAYMALEKPFHITRVAFGSGKVDEDVNLADVHQLLEYVSDGAVAARGHASNRVHLTIQFANSEHKEVKTFLLSEFIVYVEDPANGGETDLLYGTLGDYRQPVPAYDPAFPPSVFNFPLILVLSDEIDVAVSAPAGLVTYDEFDTAVKQLTASHNTDPNAHADLLRQYARIGEAGEPGSAVVLDSNGKVPADVLPEDVFGRGIIINVITIPAEAWLPDVDGPYAYRADVVCEDATTDHIPYVSLDNPSMETAEDCGLCDKAEAADGILRFWADTAPKANMVARVALFGQGGGGNGGSYVLPAATAGRLGGVKIGAGLNVSVDGTVSVDTASETEINEMLTGVFASDNK